MPDRSPRRSVFVALVAALVATLVGGSLVGPGSPAASAATAPLAKPPVPASGAYLGSSAGPNPGESRDAAIARTESLFGRRLDINHQFYKWDHTLIGPVQRADQAAGRHPFVSWKPQRTNGQVVTWGAIAAGHEDATIRSQARAARDFGAPMFAVFHHEPYDESREGWGTPADYRAAYRRVVELFRQEGATNVAWVMVLTAWDYAQGRGDAFYPGGDVIDWVAADPYNWHQRDGRWISLATAAQGFYDWGSRAGKPLMLAEWGSTEDPRDPNRKAQWYDQASATLRNWPNIRAVVYFNNLHDGYDWRVDTSPASLAAFRRLANDPYFNPRAASVAPPTTTTPPTTVPPTTAPPATVSFVGTTHTVKNARSHAVDIPAAVRAGDVMLAFLSNNNGGAPLSAIGGTGQWTLLRRVNNGSLQSEVWWSRAAAPGGSISVTTSAYAKVDMTIVAYRGVDDPAVSAGAITTSSSTVRTTPVVQSPGGVVVSYWGHKDSASTRPLTAPTGVTVRSSFLGSDGGRIASLVADCGTTRPPGSQGGLTATAAASSGNGATFTVVLSAGNLTGRA
jgi:hypothetical protein